jgi:hypothetical protein
MNDRLPKATNGSRHVWEFLRTVAWRKELFAKSSFPQIYVFIESCVPMSKKSGTPRPERRGLLEALHQELLKY